MTEEASKTGEAIERRFRDSPADMALRALIALVFLYFGTSKFSDRPGAAWVEFFNRVGAGAWFRYFTGILEILGAVLVAMNRTVTAGAALLGCVMAGGIAIDLAVLRDPGGAIVPFAFLCGLIAFLLHRRRA